MDDIIGLQGAARIRWGMAEMLTGGVIVHSTTCFDGSATVAEFSGVLGDVMVGINVDGIPVPHRSAGRGREPAPSATSVGSSSVGSVVDPCRATCASGREAIPM